MSTCWKSHYHKYINSLQIDLYLNVILIKIQEIICGKMKNLYTRIDIKHTKRQEPKIAMSNTIGEIILFYIKIY